MQLIVGSSLSSIIILKVQVSAFPAASVAMTSTGVVPIGNVEPEIGLDTMLGVVVKLSVAEGIKVTTASQTPASLF